MTNDQLDAVESQLGRQSRALVAHELRLGLVALEELAAACRACVPEADLPAVTVRLDTVGEVLNRCLDHVAQAQAALAEPGPIRFPWKDARPGP